MFSFLTLAMQLIVHNGFTKRATEEVCQRKALSKDRDISRNKTDSENIKAQRNLSE